MEHRPMQELRIPVCKEMFLITWPSKANPSTGEANFRDRQESGNAYNKNKEKKKHHHVN